MAGRRGRAGADRGGAGPHRLRRGLGQARRGVRAVGPAERHRGHPLDPGAVRLPGAHHRRVHRRHAAQQKGGALSRFANPALRRRGAQGHEPPRRPARDRAGCGKAARRHPRPDAAHHADRRFPRRDRGAVCRAVRLCQDRAVRPAGLLCLLGRGEHRGRPHGKPDRRGDQTAPRRPYHGAAGRDQREKAARKGRPDAGMCLRRL